MLFPACSKLLHHPGSVPDGAGGEGAVSPLLLHELWDTVASAVQEGCLLEESIAVWLLCVVATAAWLVRALRFGGFGHGCSFAESRDGEVDTGRRGFMAPSPAGEIEACRRLKYQT